jgi:D-sedoheptulose 7-phosphate isomerase
MSKFIDEIVTDYPQLNTCTQEIKESYLLIEECFKSGNKLFTCGNGGSASDSEHIAGELLKGFFLKRPLIAEERDMFVNLFGDEGSMIADNLQRGLPVISLVGHPSLSTAFANDVNPDFTFAQHLFGLGKSGDTLLAITTSGNSRNVIWAVKVAKMMGIKVVGLTGPTGGKLAELADICIKAPGRNVARVQEMHLPIYHTLCAWLEDSFFNEEK